MTADVAAPAGVVLRIERVLARSKDRPRSRTRRSSGCLCPCPARRRPHCETPASGPRTTIARSRCGRLVVPQPPSRVRDPRVLGTCSWVASRHSATSGSTASTCSRRPTCSAATRVDVTPALADENELVVRCAALTPRLAERRPRPAWKTRLVANQNLRWFRTAILGRSPSWTLSAAPVGPWRDITLRRRLPVALIERQLQVDHDGRDGIIDVRVVLERRASRRGRSAPHGGRRPRTRWPCRPTDALITATGQLRVPDAEQWWPATHGGQPLYAASPRGRQPGPLHDVRPVERRLPFPLVRPDRRARVDGQRRSRSSAAGRAGHRSTRSDSRRIVGSSAPPWSRSAPPA